MRTPIQTLEGGVVLYKVRLVGGPCDGVESMATHDRVLISSATGSHLYLRGPDDLYHHQADGDQLSPLQLWLQYRDQVYLDGVSVDQERETSRAFYAGIEAFFKFMETIEDLPDDACHEALNHFRRTAGGFAHATTIPKPES